MCIGVGDMGGRGVGPPRLTWGPCRGEGSPLVTLCSPPCTSPPHVVVRTSRTPSIRRRPDGRLSLDGRGAVCMYGGFPPEKKHYL